ncbi:MAG TPA: right-handed parallel beta-helix repeat-containing protein [Pyrinomonadaceae bacterium]|jgi:hypothetical protein
MTLRNKWLIKALTVIAFAFVSTTLAQAQATRTWVSGVGDDVNPCSRTAPCKTFSGAISKTAKGGQISILDPGGFGALTITKSITVDGAGIIGSALNSAVSGFTINITDPADTDATVILRNLQVDGAGVTRGVNGIRVIAAKTVVIENVTVLNQSNRAITDERTTAGAGNLFVTNFSSYNIGQTHIVINPGVGATVNAAITNVRLERSTGNSGLAVSRSANVLIRDSVISGNAGSGIFVEEAAGSVDVNVENCTITNNATGVNVFSGSPIVRLSNTMVTGNTTGLSGINIFSFGNNRIAGNNAGNGPPSGGTIPPQ